MEEQALLQDFFWSDPRRVASSQSRQSRLYYLVAAGASISDTMSTSRDDRYKHSDDSNSTTLGQDGGTDPKEVSTEQKTKINKDGSMTITTTFYRKNAGLWVQSGGVIEIKDKNGKLIERTNF